MVNILPFLLPKQDNTTTFARLSNQPGRVMKKNFILALLLLSSCLSVAAAGDIDLEQEYKKLDTAIEKTDRYVQERESRIRKYKTALGVTDDNKVQYQMT